MLGTGGYCREQHECGLVPTGEPSMTSQPCYLPLTPSSDPVELGCISSRAASAWSNPFQHQPCQDPAEPLWLCHVHALQVDECTLSGKLSSKPMSAQEAVIQ